MNDKEILINLFHKLDKSGDGKLTYSELANGLKSAGVATATAMRLMQKLDENDDGFVTFEEYVGMLNG